jgi:membrane protein DedA with SNARE-associated domain
MTDWIINWLESFGYAGIFCLMIVEHVFPPIPSEVIMPFSGFISSRNANISLGLVIAFGSLGSLIGASAWYLLGRLVDQRQIVTWTKHYGHWISLKPKDIQKATTFFQKGSSHWVVGLGRIVPGVRTYVSIPAGLSDMPIVPYLVYSAIGTVIWTGLLAIAGYLLGEQFQRVREVLSPISTVVWIGLAVGAIAWLLWRRFGCHQRSS